MHRSTLIPLSAGLTIALTTLLVATGCDDSAATVAREAADRQAEQNREMARLNRETAAGTKRLIEEETQARQQALAVQQDLQEQRTQLIDGWNDLEVERKAIAKSRHTESMLAAISSGGAATLAALLALGITFLVLFGLRNTDDSAETACELLVRDLTSDCPILLPTQDRSVPNEPLLLGRKPPDGPA